MKSKAEMQFKNNHADEFLDNPIKFKNNHADKFLDELWEKIEQGLLNAQKMIFASFYCIF
ncbi:hypothetical protein [Campylobacter lanienae]|uniref:hypothetical protein n=1 Tax=Campylobacter lanienae TaxID=75658 RepID=UPI000BB3EB11|nr:hypothetical protein [Campylobacter lanienae]